MRDYDLFDRWVDSHNVSDHTYELVDAIAILEHGLRNLLAGEPAEVIRNAIRQMDSDAWRVAYSKHDRLEETQEREPINFLRESLERIDNLYFEVGAFAHALYCYASAGMVEPASADTSIDVQRGWVDAWVKRGVGIVRSVPETLLEMPFFRLIVLGAQGRWELDHDRPVTGDQLAALSALAREPGASSTSAYERTRKTVQNLVADALGASGAKTLKIAGDRMITAASAMQWLRSQEPDYFPSSWLMPEPDDSVQDEAGDYVLVPVARAYSNVDRRPFTPDCRCDDGYEVGVRCEVVDDYWEALRRLSEMVQPRFRHPLIHATVGSLPCEEGWTRVPKAEVERQLASIDDVDREPLERATAECIAIIEADARFRPHPKGHSRKLFRYESTRRGNALAVERRKGAPVLYVRRADVSAAREILEQGRIVGSSPTGRNSNLNTIDHFKTEELVAIRPKDVSVVRAVLENIA